MEVHAAAAAAAAPAVGKRLWSYVRAAFLTARNGVVSNKRKLLLTMHFLANKRRAKAVTRAVATLLTHHHGHDYEFSCSNNSPAADPSFSGRRRLAYFPCLGAVTENDEHDEYDYGGGGYGYGSLPDAEPLARVQYYASSVDAASSLSPAPPSSSLGDLNVDLAPGEEQAELEEYAACASASASPALLHPGEASGEFSVRVSDYSSEDDEGAGGGSHAVDADAEEFIRRFYDQLRRQNTVALLPYYMQESVVAA